MLMSTSLPRFPSFVLIKQMLIAFARRSNQKGVRDCRYEIDTFLIDAYLHSHGASFKTPMNHANIQ